MPLQSVQNPERRIKYQQTEIESFGSQIFSFYTPVYRIPFVAHAANGNNPFWLSRIVLDFCAAVQTGSIYVKD